ncbi:MAG: DUF58 domain-containing protein [Thiohalomonadaceae bacterium]
MIPALVRRVREAWARRRHPAPEIAHTLTRRRVYILPTRNGWLFALVLLAMLIGAINYENSLAYALTFLLASVGVVSILHTYRNLGGLGVRAGQCRPVFAGETAVFPIGVHNGDAQARFALQFIPTEGAPVTVDLPARATTWVDICQPTTRRGRRPLGRLTIATRFPLGLLRAWSQVHLRQHCLVYPRPEADAPLPAPAGGAGEAGAGNHGAEEFAALRAYQPGDSLRQVHWKALAREQGLLSKHFAGGGGGEHCFDYASLGGLPTEARLSRLCRWILDAEQAGLRYGLALPGGSIPAGSGPAHCQRCLEALALFGASDDGDA